MLVFVITGCVSIGLIIYMGYALIQESIYTNRKTILIASSLLGITLSTLFIFFIYDGQICSLANFLQADKISRLASNVLMLILALPTLFVLWLFRTYDIREQIQRTQDNTNTSIFLKAIEMLHTQGDKFRPYRLTGVRTLLDLKSRDILKKEILKSFIGVDLSQMDLSNMDFSGADLRGADLRGADLHATTLCDTKLQGVKFHVLEDDGSRECRTYLSGINLSGAILDDVNYLKLNNTKVDLSDTDLSGADLRGVNFSGADLYRSDLSGADLRGADLRGADLHRPSKENGQDYGIYVRFSGADLRGVILNDVDDKELNKTEVTLSETDLRKTDLRKVNLSRVNLRWSDLSGADLRGADLREAKYESNTKMIDIKDDPEFDPKDRGMIFIDE